MKTRKTITLVNGVEARLAIITTATKDNKVVKYEVVKEAKKAGFSIDDFVITSTLDCSIYIGYSTVFKATVVQLQAIKLIFEAIEKGTLLPTEATSLFSTSSKLLGLNSVPGLVSSKTFSDEDGNSITIPGGPLAHEVASLLPDSMITQVSGVKILFGRKFVYNMDKTAEIAGYSMKVRKFIAFIDKILTTVPELSKQEDEEESVEEKEF